VKLATYLVLLDVVGRGCGALPCRVRALCRLLFDWQGHVGGWEVLMAIWSGRLGSPGFCSETSLPDL